MDKGKNTSIAHLNMLKTSCFYPVAQFTQSQSGFVLAIAPFNPPKSGKSMVLLFSKSPQNYIFRINFEIYPGL